MQEITLAQILLAREERVRKQQELLTTYHCPVICFTMNIAGPIKTSPLIERAFATGLEHLNSRLPREHIRFRSTEVSVTGCQAMYAVDMDALALKKICTAIEDETPLGRLFDMDVLDLDGGKLERTAVNGGSRNCIVCGAPGRGCAARRLHTVPELQSVTRSIMKEHFAIADRERIATLAVQSLIDEVMTTPKPGLVDRRNNGSHTDMDLSTFIVSANALKPYFGECVKIGQETQHLPPSDTFPLLRQAGLSAEAAMLCATGGVNTHKGAIYTMGILLGALGRLWTPERPVTVTETLLTECAKMVQAHVEADFAAITKADSAVIEESSLAVTTTSCLTAGQRLYLKQGLTGIRGEVAAGLPSVASIGLPIYKKALQAGLSANDAGTITLLHLIANVADTNLYHRGGSDGAAYAADTARALLTKNCYPSAEQIEALDDAFISRNLSPGGCADLLAVTYFLYSLDL